MSTKFFYAHHLAPIGGGLQPRQERDVGEAFRDPGYRIRVGGLPAAIWSESWVERRRSFPGTIDAWKAARPIWTSRLRTMHYACAEHCFEPRVRGLRNCSRPLQNREESFDKCLETSETCDGWIAASPCSSAALYGCSSSSDDGANMQVQDLQDQIAALNAELGEGEELTPEALAALIQAKADAEAALAILR